jgi:hypothetical protein
MAFRSGSGPGLGFLLLFNFQPASIQKNNSCQRSHMIIKNGLPFLDSNPRHLDSYFFLIFNSHQSKKRTHVKEATYENKKNAKAAKMFG